MKWFKEIFNYWRLNNLAKQGVLEQVDQELRILQHDFKVALRYLKNNYRQRLNFYNRLPLYLIIGPSTFGKTTLLANSGLELRNVHNQALQHVMSTKYCVWWFSKDAVCLDTAGVYTETNASEVRNNLIWRGFLKLLKKYRAVNPVAGLIVVLDLPVLIDDVNKRQKILNEVRERIYEVAHYSKILPIFIVFTKCDLLEGFSEFFADLKVDALTQPFGVTFTENNEVDPIQVFNGYFDDLLRCLNGRVVQRMRQEKDAVNKKYIRDFPAQLAVLRPIIAEVVNAIPVSSHLLLFGAYFTSSVQSGVPHDYLRHGLQESLGSKVQVAGKTVRGKQSYFVEDLFKKIIFAPKAWSRVVVRKFSWVALALIIGTAGVFGLSYLGLMQSYSQSMVAIERAKKILSDYKQDNTSRGNVAKLQQAFDCLNRVSNAWWSHFGFGIAVDLNNMVEKTYYSIVATSFVPQIQKMLEEEITVASAAESQKLYSALKTYLMLSRPDKLDKRYVHDWFENYWRKTLGNDAEKRAELLQQLAGVLKYKVVIKVDSQIVAAARAVLNADSTPTAKAAYENLLNRYHDQDEVFVLANNQKVSISKIYTRENFMQVIKEQIPAVVREVGNHNSDWVLNVVEESLPPSTAQAKVIGELRTLYFNNYIAVWSELFNAIKPVQFTSVKGAEEFLLSIANGSVQNLGMFKSLRENTLFADAPTEFAHLATTKFGVLADVDFTAVQSSIAEVAKYFAGITANGEIDHAVFVATAARFQNDKPDALSRLYALAVKQPEPLRGWLQGIADNSWRVLLQTTHTYIAALWAHDIYPWYQKNIVDSYPVFNPAKRSLSLEDFNAFFGPKGIMDKYFNTYLQPFVDNSQVYWVWKNLDGQHLDIPQEVLEVFIRAALIQKMFYAENSTNLGVRFALTPLEMSPNARMFVLDLEGQKISYEYGQRKVDHLIWPGPTPSSVTLEFFGANGSHVNTTQTDVWAWFRLLDKANLHALENTERFSLMFDLNGNSIRYELTPERPINPFIAGVINNFRCPEKI